MKRATAKTPSTRPKPRERKSGVEELRPPPNHQTSRNVEVDSLNRIDAGRRPSAEERPSRPVTSERDAIDVTDDALFESSLLDYQDEYEGLDLIDDDTASWLGDDLGPLAQMERFPDDGEKRRELRRLQRLRGR